MALRADDLIDRRRLRRKLTFWRVAAILLAAAAAVAATVLLLGQDRFGVATDHIAKVRIEGTITEDEDLLETLEEVGESARVKGVILAIDSPGGTTAGGEAIFEAVRRLATGYLHTVYRAVDQVNPAMLHLPRPEFTADDPADGLGWLETERRNLVAVIRHSASTEDRRDWESIDRFADEIADELGSA